MLEETQREEEKGGGGEASERERETEREGCRWWAEERLFPFVAMATRQHLHCDEATVAAARARWVTAASQSRRVRGQIGRRRSPWIREPPSLPPPRTGADENISPFNPHVLMVRVCSV